VHLQTLPPGFDAANVMSAQVSLDDARYHDAGNFHKLLQQSLDDLKHIPGVESAAMGLSLPFERGLNDNFYLADGPDAGKNYMSSVVYVTPEYFRVLRIPLLSGRHFTEDDTADSERVIIINVAFAGKFFHSTNVVGRHIHLGKANALIVGVVGDVTKQPGLVISAPLDTEVTYYLPASQVLQQMLNLVHVWFQPSWIVRTNGPVAGLTQAMQKAIAQADSSLPIASFHPLSDLQALALRQQRFEVLLLGVLASLALLLSLIGVYGLVSNMVVQRTREIGIRMALGASLGQAMMEIGSTGFKSVGLGLSMGLVLAIISVRIMKSELYGIKTYDPITFVAVLALLVLAAAIATFAPNSAHWPHRSRSHFTGRIVFLTYGRRTIYFPSARFIPRIGLQSNTNYLRPCFSRTAVAPCMSYSTIYPAMALAATVYGLARYINPGPLLPGKLRFCALITT
jgi:predicted permease